METKMEEIITIFAYSISKVGTFASNIGKVHEANKVMFLMIKIWLWKFWIYIYIYIYIYICEYKCVCVCEENRKTK